MKFVFARDTLEKCSNTKFNKIHPVGDKVLHANRRTEGQTEVTQIIVAFQNFFNAPKNPPSTPTFREHNISLFIILRVLYTE
jgi:hypothetical protein